ncbi:MULTISPECIES: hypothetical protein [Streptococcus]|uniref:hypothetical protein n=1 Tax=Streptococcus TaxID=1301 RepID=UPI00228330A0|nr:MULTISPECIES: hypothetical protein [Streptococcus]MDU6444698.1 hypothetical protein [Streptococcus sp.]MDU6638174.1 hypothetical protein [Streptococcus sp.]MDU7209865.1 hypothetical protein [Streptococcus sp.]
MIFLIFWTMGNILVNVKKHGFNLEEELWIGLWVGYVTELLDTPWSGCFATSTAFFKTTKLVEDNKKSLQRYRQRILFLF